ncbi:UDP-galactopyranose mutase [Lactococcus lactis]|nr:UDP-galactopyranose mutase [Lactococcus lactis]
MNTFYQMWGVKTPEEAAAKIEEQKAKVGVSGIPKNLEEQAN